MAMIFDIQAKLAAAAEKYTEKGKDIMAKVAVSCESGHWNFEK